MSEQTAQQTPDSGTPRARSDGENAVKIGLWGPPQSGKTTYLAALPIAVSDGNSRNGSWIIFPRSPKSRVMKEKFEKVLVEDRRFPQTTVGASDPLEWLFVGNLAGSKYDRRWPRWRRRGELESRFMLDLIDVQGDAYHNDPDQETAKSEAASAALDHLADAQGIIYLFDPIGERDNRDSAAYVRGTVNELLERAARNGRPRRYLPHQVSVCITKFDDGELFDQARRMKLVTDGDDGMPRVRDNDAEQFFDELCSGRFWNKRYERGQHSAQYVREQIRNVFHPDRIRYFVTSSIGFWMEPPIGDKTSAWFDPDKSDNTSEWDDQPGIVGKVRPINVLEPLISLQQRLARR
jgi:hypothetical protein